MSNVRLRQWAAQDAAEIASILDDPEVRKWSHIAELGVHDWVADQRAGRRGPSLAVCDVEADIVVGNVALRLPGHASPATTCDAIRPGDQPAGELSYWVLPHARGRGVATAAVRAMLGIARGFDELRSVVLDIELGNAGSVRVAERVGATRREPTRVEHDRQGVARTLAVYVIRLSRVVLAAALSPLPATVVSERGQIIKQPSERRRWRPPAGRRTPRTTAASLRG